MDYAVEFLKAIGMEDCAELIGMEDKEFDEFYPNFLTVMSNTDAKKTLKDGLIKTVHDGTTKSTLQEELSSLQELANLAKEGLSETKAEFIQYFVDLVHDALDLNLRTSIPMEIVVGENGKCPTYLHENDACADIYAAEDVKIKKGEICMIDTDIKISVPEGYVVHIYPRSGLSSRGIHLANNVGVIDYGYKDSIKVCLQNLSKDTWHVEKGDRIAQMSIDPSPRIDFQTVGSFTDATDRNGGFGSTGK